MYATAMGDALKTLGCLIAVVALVLGGAIGVGLTLWLR